MPPVSSSVTIRDVARVAQVHPGTVSRALNEETIASRDRWEAVAEESPADGIPRLRAEALLRLALLEFSSGRPELAESYVRRLGEPDLKDAVPVSWKAGLSDLARLAPDSEHGGGPLPVGASTQRREGQNRERTGRDPVRDR